MFKVVTIAISGDKIKRYQSSFSNPSPNWVSKNISMKNKLSYKTPSELRREQAGILINNTPVSPPQLSV